ncbi:MAG: hypothetical protein WCJ75_18210, partial [Desulfomonile sp.]
MDFIRLFGMCDDHYRKTAQTHGNPALFFVVKPSIPKCKGGPGENIMCIGKVNAVFLDITLSLPFIPSESHGFIIHIIIHITRRHINLDPRPKKMKNLVDPERSG